VTCATAARALALAVLVAGAAPGCRAAAHDPGIDGARAMRRLRHQVDAGMRIPGTPAHDSVRVWLAAELERLGARVEQQRFTDSTLGRPVEMTNVIGRWGPDGGRRIALLSHWDSRPMSDRDPDPALRTRPCPGANDGASSVAVLLEVAEQLATRKPAIGIDLVFVDGEDLGTDEHPEGFCRGSKDLAARMRAGTTPRDAAVFVFDMIGDADLDIHPEVRAAREAANVVQLVQDAAVATGARHFAPDPRYDLTDDHTPFLDAGIPAVDIIDFDYPQWHTTRDLPDRCSEASLAEVAGVASWIVYESPLAHPAP